MTKFVIDESGVVMSYDQWQQIHLPSPSNDSTISTTRKTPAPKPSKPRTICDLCGSQVRIDRLDKHRQKVHVQQGQSFSEMSSTTPKHSIVSNRQPITSPIQERAYTHCLVCDVIIRTTRVATHMQKMHRTAMEVRRSSTTTSTKARQSQVPSSYPTNSNDNKPYYSTNDSMDGGKYLGHIRRDVNGQFGSLPLYDDYSEESDAN